MFHVIRQHPCLKCRQFNGFGYIISLLLPYIIQLIYFLKTFKLVKTVEFKQYLRT